MPNRSIRESARTSATLYTLSDGAERMFWRLTTVADDFGRFEADPRILKALCFPLWGERLKTVQVDRWLGEMVACELVQTYVCNGKQYGFFPTWERHQTRRAKHSKFPEPTPENICSHVHANVSEVRGSNTTEDRKHRDTNNGPAHAGQHVQADARKSRRIGEAREVLAWLNDKAGRNFRANDVNLGFITARLEDGITVGQLKAITSRKARAWTGTERAQYLRPETLYGKTKCEQYLGELPKLEDHDGDT